MRYPHKQIGQIYMKRAVICADSFHVIRQFNDSLAKLSIPIMKRYDTDSIEYYLLKHWRFLLFDRTIDLDNKGRFNKKLNWYINYRLTLNLILFAQFSVRYRAASQRTIYGIQRHHHFQDCFRRIRSTDM